MGYFNVTLKLDEHSIMSPTISCDIQDFIECVYLIEVEDICMTGMHYTWIKSLSNPIIIKKLDRVMANEDFFTKYNHAFVVFHPFIVSNHSPSVLIIPHALAKKGSPLSLQTLVKATKKLQWINGDVIKRVEKLRSKLEEAHIDVNNFPYDSKKKEFVASTLEEFNKAMNEEEMFLFQRDKVNWLYERNRNTAYFHKVVKSKRNKNRVMSITNVMMECVEGSKVTDEFVNHFEKFLGQSTHVQHLDSLGNVFNNILSIEEASAMVTDVSDRETKTTVFGIDDCKAPGPDGYKACFFKKACSLISNDVCLVIKEFFSSGKLLREVNSTLIALIPKVH
ncbi:hypothetical protein Tco_0516507 [Tanacetum coccineum]